MSGQPRIPARFGNALETEQALAWMCWATEEAILAFSGPDARDLWERTKRGIWPAHLGPPTRWAPADAERDLWEAARSGRLKPVPIHGHGTG